MAEEAKIINTNAPQLDENCIQLLDEVQQHFPVRFEEWDKTYCAFRVMKRDNNGLPIDCNVFCSPQYKNSAIAHELLHAKCEILFGNDFYVLYHPDEECELAKVILNREYWEVLSNHIQHQIFYKEYIKLGYVAKDFFSAFIFEGENEVKKFLKRDDLKVGGTYNPSLIACFLNLVSRFMFYPLDNRFEHYLRKLQKLDPKLYKIHRELFEVVRKIKLDPNDRDMLISAETTISNSLYQWININKISAPTEGDLRFINKLSGKT